MSPQPPSQDALLFKNQEGGRRPRSVRLNSYQPLHQACFHDQPRHTASSSSSQMSVRSRSSPALTEAAGYGKALLSLWQLQAVDGRKPNESPSCVAPGITSIQLPRGGGTPVAAAACSRRDPKSHERRCDEVLSRLMCDSSTWGLAQERQARLVDSNRALARKNSDLRRECAQDVHSGADALMQTFGTSQEEWRSRRRLAPFVSGVSAPLQTSYSSDFGAESALGLARAKAKTATGLV